MKVKLLGISICTLLIFTAALPVAVTMNIDQNESIFKEIGSNIEPIVDDWWPMYNHDLQNSGFTTSEAPDTATVKWFFRVNSQMSSPVVTDGRVYVGDGKGNLYCLNMDTSEKIWDFATGGEISSTVSPAVVNDRVYVCSGNGKVYCLNEENGEEIWYYKTSEMIESSPAIANGRVYFGCYDDKLYCLDVETGGKIWAYQTDDAVISSPAIANDKVYFGSFDKKVYCLNAVTGTKIWEYETNNVIQTASPSISNGKLYIGSDDNKLYCLDAETGDKIWDYTTEGGVRSSPVVAYGNVYFGSVDGNAYCLDAETGEKIWEYDLGNWIHSSPSVADNKVYIACMGGDGQICCLNAQTGELIWNYHPMGVWSSPAIADGKLFFGCYNFYCFEDGPYYPPNVPDINGPTHGEPNTQYDFTFVTTEPNGDDIFFYVKWGDGTDEDWFGPYESGEEATLSHAFPDRDTYYIRAKAKDQFGLESDWARFDFSTPRDRFREIPMFRLFELLPNLIKFFKFLI
jgi:outer membrane protein assembly factor BamB